MQNSDTPVTAAFPAAEIAARLVQARRDDDVLLDYPGVAPQNLAEGYAVQEAALALTAKRPLGWKVGRIADDLVERLGENRLAGPIMSVVEGGAGTVVDVPLLGGFSAIEGEILIRMGHVPEADATDAALLDAIAEVRLGAEIAASPFTGINRNGPAVTISDFGNNFGLVLGPVMDRHAPHSWLDQPVRVRIDDVEIGTGLSRDVLDGPLGALRFVIGHLAKRGRPLTNDQWVSCGAVTGVHPFVAGQIAEIRLGAAAIHCRGVAARPHVGSKAGELACDECF